MLGKTATFCALTGVMLCSSLHPLGLSQSIAVAQPGTTITADLGGNPVQYYQTYQQAIPVAVPSPQPQPVLAPPPSIQPGLTGNAVVIVAEVQVVGGSPDVQQRVLNTIQTRSGGETSQGQIQNDVAAISSTGLFTDVQVVTRPTPAGLNVSYTVQPLVVRSFQLEGAQVLPPEVVNQVFQAQLGAPVNPSALDEGVQQINQWYKQNGYTRARVLSLRPSLTGVVTVAVAEGVINQVKFRFTTPEGKFADEQGPIQGRTQEAFLRREIQLKPGQVFRESVARQDVQQLYQLGLFNQVNVVLGGDATNLDVTYALNERRSRNVNLGGGYNEDTGIFGVISLRDQNVGGVGQQLATDLQLSVRDFQFNSNFLSPYRATNPDQPGYKINAFRRRGLSEVFDDKITLASGDQAREGRFGGGITFSRPVGDWIGSLGLNYVRISVRDRDGNIQPTDRQGNTLSVSGTGIDDLTTLSFALSQDRRDHPLNPSRGEVLNLGVEQSIPIGLGSILMNRLQANYIQYVPVRWLATTGDFPEVVVFNLQGGTALGDLPPYNAFTLGGPNSVRGYASGDVGNGRSYILAATEYRFPLLASPLAGVLFADFASDLGSGGTVLGAPAVVRNKPGTGFGYGAGLRLQSPIGVVRADLGINDRGETRLQVGIGQRF